MFCLSVLLNGCSTLGIALFYKKTPLPDTQIVRNIRYSNAADADPIKNTLNLFLPKDSNFPSAGAQLASRIALDSAPLKALGLSPNLLCGVIPISGVGYNFLSDEEYQLGKDDNLYQKLFNQENISTKQKKKMSPILFAKKSAPAFLVLYAKGEQKEIRHASEDFYGWLKSVGTESQIYELPNVGHKSEILALSRPKAPAIATLIFIRTSDCGK